MNTVRTEVIDGVIPGTLVPKPPTGPRVTTSRELQSYAPTPEAAIDASASVPVRRGKAIPVRPLESKPSPAWRPASK